MDFHETLTAAATARRPLVVAPVCTPGDLAEAAAPDLASRCDILEVRADAFADDPGALREFVRDIPGGCPPLLLTVRHPDEGGANALDLARRRELLDEFLPCASAVDIELRSAEDLAGVISSARRAGRAVVLSRHDFGAAIPAGEMRDGAAAAAAAGASVYKVATTPSTLEEVAALGALCADTALQLPVAAMGMGPLGRRARLVCLAAGSVLNYGFLTCPNAPGQWPAVQLKRIAAGLERDAGGG